MKIPKHILPTIVLSQFLCTSLWFAGNGVMNDIILKFHLLPEALGYLTAAIQLGFIAGTLIFAILSIADRYAPSTVFFICAVAGAIFNAGVIWNSNTLISILFFRFSTGFFLAGIYPVGMKIAADYFDKGLGKSLGFLVGALVVGTAFPHLLKEIKGTLPWQFVIMATSFLAVFGGILMIIFVPNGPFRKPSLGIRFSAITDVFKDKNFRAAAFGYFGHMWELYAFWAFVPILLTTYNSTQSTANYNISLASFLIIGFGGISCVISGYLSQYLGVKKVAFSALLLSGCCCLLSPLIFLIPVAAIYLVFLLFWGMVVIADSPLFSTLVAQNAPVELKGTALTIVNSIGFFLTVCSILLIDRLRGISNSNIIFMLLAVGPIIGLIALRSWKK